MLPTKASAGEPLTIAQVESQTGLSKHTLRMWQRRYGFPQPQRSGAGDRCYPQEQMRKLQLLRSLVADGHRAGSVVPLPVSELEALQQRAAPSQPAAWMEPYLSALRHCDLPQARALLMRDLMSMGLMAFMAQRVAVMNQCVGDLWSRGELAVVQEQVYSEAVQAVLRHAILPLQCGLDGTPRVVLATPEGERHVLGLLMAEAALALQGCPCLALGTQVPLGEICQAAHAYPADVIGLSFTAVQPRQACRDSLAQLLSALPEETEIWIGGNTPRLKNLDRRLRLVQDIAQVPALVQRWRAGA